MTSTFKVFISSPSDVAGEREIVRQVIGRLNGEFRGTYEFRAIDWQQSYYTATSDFQNQIPRPSQSDVVICILWNRLGSPLPPNRYRRADGSAYLSGTEFEFEDAHAGALATGGIPDILVYRKLADAPVPTSDRRAREEAHTQYLALETFWTRWFRSEEGHFTAAYKTFHAPEEFSASIESDLRAWLARHDQVVWPEAKGSPFRGLEPFDESHSSVFFGRRRVIEQLRARLIKADLNGVPFLLLIGMSGAGKSSLARAGLAARLIMPGAVPDVDVWRRLIVRPHELGPHPVAGLASKLYDAIPELKNGDYGQPDEFAKLITANPDAAIVPLRSALARASDAERRRTGIERQLGARLLLVLDQLEELFALDPAERARLTAFIDHLVKSRTTWVIATMRSDFYAALQEIPELLNLKQLGGQFDVVPPGPSDIRDIIEGPARAAGLVFEKLDTGEGVDEVLEKAATTPGALPLLQFTLDVLYERRVEGRLTAAAYLELGGLAGAIMSVANTTFEKLAPAEQAALPDLLWALVDHPLAEDQRPTLRTALLSSVTRDQAAAALVHALVDSRLLVVGREGVEPMLRLAHEALILHWPRARELVAADRELSRVRQRVEGDESYWRRHDCAPDFLLPSGKRLAEASDLLARRRASLKDGVIGFIEASEAAERNRLEAERARELARERERVETMERAARERLEIEAKGARRLARRTRWAAIALAVLLAGSIVSAVIAQAERHRAQLSYEAGLGAADTLINKVVLPLRDTTAIPVEVRRQILEEAETAYERLIGAADNTAELRLRRAKVLMEMVDAYSALSDLDTALKRAEMARAIYVDLSTADPSNSELLGELSRVWARIGEIKLDQRDQTGAMEADQAALKIAQQLTQQHPGDRQWQRDLSICWDRIGELNLASGDRPAALAAYQQSLEIREQVAAGDKTNPGSQRDLAIAWQQIGEVRRGDDLPGTLDAFEHELQIFQTLVKRDAANSQWRRDLAFTWSEIGDAKSDADDWQGALSDFQAELALARDLAAQDKSNAIWQRDLVLADERLGLAKVHLGDRAAAEQAFDEAETIIAALIDSHQGDSQLRRDQAWLKAQLAVLEKQ
ncbi:MAG TPA: AAA family ATPase [Stellaceae bacterium]|nr:AAA family ATPase [Stellaceae bacterium]